MTDAQLLLIGLVSISDRASAGVYEDKGIPGLKAWFDAALSTPWRMETRLIPDEQALIERTLVELVDVVGCHLVLTTGGTGPAPRDVTPEATLAVAHKGDETLRALLVKQKIHQRNALRVKNGDRARMRIVVHLNQLAAVK